MSTATLQRAARAPATASAPTRALGRACACGESAGVSGKCTGCVTEDWLGRLPLQAKLTVSTPDDPDEREADRVADQIMRSGPTEAPPRISPLVQRQAAEFDNDELQTKAVDTAAAPSPGFATRLAAASAGGTPLPGAARGFFESGFGRDLRHVRIHDDGAAAGLARDIAARAFTLGKHIYFAPGQYDPSSTDGRRLLAHELTHTVQQGAGTETTLRRAVARIGGLSVTVDYGPVINVTAADLANRIIALASGWAGAPPDAAQEMTIRALPGAAQTWLLFSLQLVSSNNAAAGALDRILAVQRLLSHAPRAQRTPLPDAGNLFVHEALEVSGWLEAALGGRLTAPNAATRTSVGLIVNPPPTTGSISDPLDVSALRARLPVALRALLTHLDPATWTSVGTRSISAFQTLGDIIQNEARGFFAPYADAAIGNLFSVQPAFHASANIFDVGTLSPTIDQRLGYLANRAEIVGRAAAARPGITDLNIFADTHFDPTRTADEAELESIIVTLEADPAVGPIVDRLIQHTGRQSGSGATASIGLVTEFDASARSACQDHWSGIDTLCHEVLHALAHPAFRAASTRYSFPQVIREGFTEVLGNQLFNNDVIPKAAGDAAFKATLETGVAGAPCPAPAAGTIGYGSAGTGAEAIRASVGNDNFRAAYFLGRTDLAGLP